MNVLINYYKQIMMSLSLLVGTTVPILNIVYIASYVYGSKVTSQKC